MKLARLELSGFKSFADYTEFVFDDGITGIVGPNGCGKSNVVDAVKWVLGEMSAKSLRGDAMLDVIFNGSGTRKPMGMAEVSLTFTNEDRRLPIDADTVKVTRRLYRDATSEYLINNQMSRLKDIRELFLDTGVGVDAYSLIEQGRVSALLESNSQDRREIFEEAAGISRFKQRKKEALRKLEKTDQNLAQSQLVLEEVEKQLRSVKVQAGRARNYQEYAARLKELRSAYVMQEYDGLHKKVVGLNEQLEGVVDNLAAVRREMEGKRNRQAELQMELEGAQEAARKAERELLASQNEQASAKQRGEFAQQQILHLSEQRELLTGRRGDVEERLQGRAEDVKRHEEAVAAIDQKLREHEAEVAEASLKQEQASKAIAGLNRSVDEHKSKAIDLMRQLARLHNDINGLRINQENLTNQKGRIEQRKLQVDSQIAELKGRVGELEGRKNELTEQSATLQEEANTVRAEQQANNQKMAGISQELARQREHRSGLKSRQNVLNDLQNKREGVSQVVRELLKSRDAGKGFGYVKGIVADALSTDLEHATVIEAALGELQNAVVVSDSSALLADQEHWQKLAGRVTVLAADKMLAYQDGYDWSRHGKRAVAAIDLVKTEGESSLLMHQLLGRTIVVDSLADALELAEAGPREYRFVTRSGEVIEAGSANHALTLGDMSKRGGIITRRAEVAKLEQELADVEATVNELTGQISQCDQTSRELDARQQELRQRIYQADSQRAEVNAQLQQTSSQLQRTTSEAPLLAGEIESIERQILSAAERQAEFEEKAAGVEAEQKKVEAVVHELGSQLIVRQHEVSELAEAATRARVAMGQVQEQRSGINRELATARQAVSQMQMELQRLINEAELVEGRIGDAEATVAQTEEVLKGLAEKIAIAESELATHTEQVSVLRNEFTSVNSGLDTIQEQIEHFSRREHELSLAKNELSVRIETLIEHTMEELQINLHEAYSTYQAQDMDWDAVASEISELKGKISRLGNVNLDAILEQSQLEERQASISAQLADIIDAKRQLEELITKINEDSRVRFAESFAAVRTEFQEMFRKLFGGGKADLILENPEDILESGIEIMARPPGKEPQSMSLLSGGEKTMTAVALVMSIFKSKPSPFCILDEVDAALDEANTTRFAGIIQDFLQYSQFIVITHNKRTMSVASTLYGVTMQEQGCSKRVAVKFDGKGTAVIPAPGAPRQAAETAAA
ncbi:MAG: chromosome segregation protein SMC [Phycisphaerae bacterium]